MESVIGIRIKTRREELGLSQEDLAKRLGYKSRSSINKIELGKNDITQHKVVAFAKALNTTTSYLMGWDTDLNKKEDAITDIFKRLREDTTFFDAVQKLYTLNDQKLEGVITMISSFEQH